MWWTLRWILWWILWWTLRIECILWAKYFFKTTHFYNLNKLKFFVKCSAFSFDWIWNFFTIIEFLIYYLISVFITLMVTFYIKSFLNWNTFYLYFVISLKRFVAYSKKIFNKVFNIFFSSLIKSFKKYFLFYVKIVTAFTKRFPTKFATNRKLSMKRFTSSLLTITTFEYQFLQISIEF